MRQASGSEAIDFPPAVERPAKLRRVTTADAIFNQLYADIVSLRMPPGMALQEKKIAEEFGVSRTPVREALLRLAEGGLVDIYPQSGTVVSRVPVSAIPEAVVVRKALEDTSGFHEEDEAFHEAITRIAGYPGIWAILKTVKVQIDRARRLTLPALGRMDNVVREHIVIRDAIASHDVDAAREAILHHLSAVIPDVAELRTRYPDYFC